MRPKKLLDYFLFLCLFLLIFGITSCRKDFTSIPSSGTLTFSKDTVFLDTVFTNIGSATYQLKVYNRSNSDMHIPSITLENGSNSNYRLNVDGVPGKSFQNVDILANDSLFVFIETTIDITNVTDPLYTDRILFDEGIHQQDVDLVTLVRDATFIFPGRNPVTLAIDSLTLSGEITPIKGRFLQDQELTFTNSKPYVIYGYAAVPTGKTLTIEEGTELYFHTNSGLIIDEGAQLLVNGTQQNKVLFQGDRLEQAFSSIPGQWGAIWIRSGSTNNHINHAIIKNGTVGLLVDNRTDNTPTLVIQNSEIYNHASYGLLARAASIHAENLVVGNAGQSSAAFIMGGQYSVTHSTFANYWNTSIRPLPTVLLNNYASYTNSSGDAIVDPLALVNTQFTNCIIDGNGIIEFLADRVDGAEFSFFITNTMIKFNDPSGQYSNIPELDFSNPQRYQNILLNGTADFKNSANQNFIIGSSSAAINLGNSQGAQSVPFDLLGFDRTSSPDAGAYQHQDF